VSWTPAGARSRELREFPWRDGRPADDLGAGCGEPGGGRPRVIDLEREPDVRADPLPDLHAVDHGRLGRVGQLEGRVPGVQDYHPRVSVALERGLLGEPEDVTVERDRLVEVIGRDDDPQLPDSAHGHGATIRECTPPGSRSGGAHRHVTR
jgi:hypothetical protein